MAQKQNARADFQFKFLLVGDCETGKTAIKNQLSDNQFTTKYKSTLGIDEGEYRGDTDQGSFRVILYDTSGQERFSDNSVSNANICQAVFFVYDVNKPATLENMESRINKVNEKNTKNLQMALLGNKIDLLKTVTAESTKAKASEIASRYNLERLECSAKERSTLTKAMDKIIRELIRIQILNAGTSAFDQDVGKTAKSTFKWKTEAGGKSEAGGMTYKSVIDEDAEYRDGNQEAPHLGAWKQKG